MSANPIIFSPIGRTKAIANGGNQVYAYAFDPITGRTFLGGFFTTLSGVSRTYIGAYEANGTVSSWYPSVNYLVNTMVVDGSRLYIGGSFTTVNGATRNGIAILDTSSGGLYNIGFYDDLGLTYSGPYDGGAYSPGVVNNIAIDDNRLHLTGQFSRIIQEYVEYSFTTYVQNHVVVSKTTGDYLYHVNGMNNDGDTSSGTINKTVVSGGNVYCVGPFNEFLSSPFGVQYAPFQFGAYNASTGAINTSLLPMFGTPQYYGGGDTGAGFTHDVAVLGGIAYVVGSFPQVNGISRPYITGLNISSGAVTSFTVTLGGSNLYIRDIRTDGTYLYIYGSFTTVNGVTVNNFAALDTSGNLVSTKRLNLTLDVSIGSNNGIEVGQNLQNVPDGIMHYDLTSRLKVWDTRYQSPRN